MSRMHRQQVALFSLPERSRYDAGQGGGPEAATTLMDSSVGMPDQTRGMLWTTDRNLFLTRAQGTGLSYLERRADLVVGLSLYDFFRTHDPEFGPIAAHRNALVGHAMNFEFRHADRMFFGLAEPLFD